MSDPSGDDPQRRFPSIPSRPDDAARTVAVRRISPGRGGGRPIPDDATASDSPMTDAVRLLPSPTFGGTIRRRRDDDSASSVSLFFRLSLCLRSGMSIAGNNVPPVPDDIESMGGTNSEISAPHPPRPGHPLPRGEGTCLNPLSLPLRKGENEQEAPFPVGKPAIPFDRLLNPCYKLRPYAADRPLDSKTRRLRRTDVELARSLKVVPITMSDIGKHKLNGLIRFKERLQN